MELETLTVVMAVAAMVMLYGAVTNRNPLEVIKAAVSGEDITAAAPLSTGAGALTNVVAGTATASPGNLHSDGTARFFPNNTPRYTDDPVANTLPESDPRRRFVPANGSHVLAAKDATRAQGGYTTGASAAGIGGTPMAGQFNG